MYHTGYNFVFKGGITYGSYSKEKFMFNVIIITDLTLGTGI